MDNDIFERPHQHPNASLPLRERIGWIIFAWDALVAGRRDRDYYLAMADDILKEHERQAT